MTITLDEAEKIATILASVVAVFGGLATAYGFLGLKRSTDRLTLIGTAFRNVVSDLASDKEATRLAGAILLRRFFDRTTEYGEGRLPYAREAVSVIAGLLRTLPAGEFQKVLADGLRFAPTLASADLQNVRLDNAYLGDRAGPHRVILTGADLYRASICHASLRNADADGAVFYKADLSGTVFAGANLRKADFRSATARAADFRGARLEGAHFDLADLEGARFDGARLHGASFHGAKNVPDSVRKGLNADGVFAGA